jgi:hypothetical protein
MAQEPIDTSNYIQIKLDWPAYYAKFKEKHGLYPIKFGKGRILFEDGWTYSSTDISGPEYPPPSHPHELWKLKVTYWYHRRRLVKHERDYILKQIEDLRAFQINRDCPLQYQIIRTNEEHGEKFKAWIETEDLEENLQKIESGRLEWLVRDIDLCDEKLTELKTNKPSGVEEGRLVAS